MGARTARRRIAVSEISGTTNGEWTRRRIDDEDAAKSLGRKLKIPVYDAGIVGYPQRMRDYTRRKAEEEKRRDS